MIEIVFIAAGGLGAWGLWPGARFVTVGPLDWIGPRLDLPEGR